MTPSPPQNRRTQTAIEAAEASPQLASLAARAQASAQRLEALRSLMPAPLFSQLAAGPVDEGGWCLLVKNNAAAAKVRQLLPALEAHLRTQRLPVSAIRVKVLGR
jgi:hypothetical protein